MNNKIRGSKIRNKILKSDKDYKDNLDDNSSLRKFRGSKIKRKTDKELEREATQEENMSILLIVVIVVLCFAVGIGLGVCLYKLAMNSSNSALIINRLLFR